MVAIASSIALQAQPSPPHLDLRCPAPCTFRQGESIWLDLVFTAGTPNNYRVLTNYTDREMAREEFAVTPPEGASDPIKTSLGQIKPTAGSFHFIHRPVTDVPVTVRMNLNQFVRFDQPGTFHVRVNSNRVSDASIPRVLTAVPAQSNEIVVQIVPVDPEWQAEQLAYLVKVLDRGLSQSNEPPNEIRDLCNLGTEGAAIAIARRVGDEKRFFFLYEFGLIRSPYRAEGLREMERLLVDPNFGVSELFLAAMASSYLPSNSNARAVKQAEIRKELQDSLPAKRGAARATSEDALQKFR